MTDKKLVIRIIGGVMLATVLLLGVQAWLDTSKQFHSPTWRAAVGEGGLDRRVDMVDDLMLDYLQPGMAYDDVLALLGRATAGDARDPDEPKRLVYALGTCDALFPIDSWYLIVSFDADDRTTDARKHDQGW